MLNSFSKTIIFIFHYVSAVFLAILSMAVFSILFKIALITDQGPTLASSISEFVIYYTTLSMASFLIFKTYSKKMYYIGNKRHILFMCLLIVLHIAVMIYSQWSKVFILTTSSLPLERLIFTKESTLIESIRNIPIIYHYIALAAEDLCFLFFSIIGSTSRTTKHSKVII